MEEIYNKIRTGFGCKVIEKLPESSEVKPTIIYYECDNTKEAVLTALEFLDSFDVVTIYAAECCKPEVYGYINFNPTFSADEFVYIYRSHGPITDDTELIVFAQKLTKGWLNSGEHQSFTKFAFSDYPLSEPCRSLTVKEFIRLKELQKTAQEKAAETQSF